MTAWEDLPIWARPARQARATSSSLSIEQIVRAAVQLADAHGIDAVSMRRIAAELNSGAMSLYRHVSTKDDLLDLMLDGVMGETLGDVPEGVSISSGDLRQDLKRLGFGLRAQIHLHPWLPQVMSGRPAFGPNVVRALEIGLSLYDGRGLTADTMMNAVGVVNSFVLGFVSEELAEQEMQRRTGLTETEWQRKLGPYVQGLLDTGKYPRVAKVFAEGSHADDHAAEFAAQLNIVIEGVLATIDDSEKPI